MTSGKDRQKKFQDNLKALGYIGLTIFISPEAVSILKSEKERTGETNAQIITRALCSLTTEKSVTTDNLTDRIRALSAQYRDKDKIHAVLKSEGFSVSRKEVREICKSLSGKP